MLDDIHVVGSVDEVNILFDGSCPIIIPLLFASVPTIKHNISAQSVFLFVIDKLNQNDKDIPVATFIALNWLPTSFGITNVDPFDPFSNAALPNT